MGSMDGWSTSLRTARSDFCRNSTQHHSAGARSAPTPLHSGWLIFTAFSVWLESAKARKSCKTIRWCFSSSAPASGGNMRFGPFLGIAILLMILWLGGFLMFHVASGLIHLLLLFAVISLIVHFVTAPKTA